MLSTHSDLMFSSSTLITDGKSFGVSRIDEKLIDEFLTDNKCKLADDLYSIYIFSSMKNIEKNRRLILIATNDLS